MSNKHLDLLGMPAKDIVTGFKGVVSSISFDLYGCVQAAITPPVEKGKDIAHGHWFDVTRIKVSGKLRVMDLPDYEAGYTATGKKGAAEKPTMDGCKNG